METSNIVVYSYMRKHHKPWFIVERNGNNVTYEVCRPTPCTKKQMVLDVWKLFCSREDFISRLIRLDELRVAEPPKGKTKRFVVKTDEPTSAGGEHISVDGCWLAMSNNAGEDRSLVSLLCSAGGADCQDMREFLPRVVSRLGLEVFVPTLVKLMGRASAGKTL